MRSYEYTRYVKRYKFNGATVVQNETVTVYVPHIIDLSLRYIRRYHPRLFALIHDYNPYHVETKPFGFWFEHTDQIYFHAHAYNQVNNGNMLLKVDFSTKYLQRYYLRMIVDMLQDYRDERDRLQKKK